MSNTMIPFFAFHQQDYSILEELVNAMGVNWLEGQQLLFGGKLREHTRKVEPSFANLCASAEKEYQSMSKEADYVFLKWLCKYPGIKNLYWQGASYGGINRIYNAITTHEQTVQKLLIYMLTKQFLSVFFVNIGGTDELVNNTRFLEKLFNKQKSRFTKRNAIPILECFLKGEKVFSFANRRFQTPMDLANHLQPFADKSKGSLSQVIQPLFQNDNNFEPQFEAWIIMHGFHHELILWKERFQDGQNDGDDIVDFYSDDDHDQAIEACQQLESDFAESLDGFEAKFIDLLSKYQDRIGDSVAFNALMSDYFPAQKLQSYLLVALYRMDIIKTIREASELNDLLTIRFEKRLIKDFGVKEMFARWAVYEWCHCYGEQVLNKENSIQPVTIASFVNNTYKQ